MALNTIGSIAIFIVESFDNVPTGVSGNMVEIVDMNRQHVANFTGQSIGSNSIQDEYQPPIVNLSKADTIDFSQAQSGGEKVRLDDLTVEETGQDMSAKSYRMLAESQLNALGRRSTFRRSLS